ncbi:hypothetical protein Tsubulata_021422, partial [Turnera subulata]
MSCRPRHVSGMSPAKIQGAIGAVRALYFPGIMYMASPCIRYESCKDSGEGVSKIDKERIEAIDYVNLFIKYRVIDGDVLKGFKDFFITVKATPKPNGEGTLVHWHLEYEKLHEGTPDPQSFLQYLIDLSKDIDDHHVTQGIHNDHGQKLECIFYLEKRMSLKGNLEAEVEVKTDPKTIHDVFSCRPHHISNMTPEKIQGVDLHEEGVPKIAKEVVEAIDDVNLSTTFKVIEGDLLTEYKDFKTTVKATPKASGEGTIVHWHFEYENCMRALAKTVLYHISDQRKTCSSNNIKEDVALEEKLEMTVEIISSAEDFFKFLCNQTREIPSVSPDKVQRVDVDEDNRQTDGSVIMSWTVVIDGQPEILKEKIQVDEAKKSMTFTIIGGHVIPKENGSLVAMCVEFEKKKPEITPPYKYLELVAGLLKRIISWGKKMSLKGTMEGEVEIKTDATIFHDVFSCRPHHISGMSPSKIQGVDLHEGDWGTEGTIICWSYVHDGESKIAKERIEAIDDVNLFTKYRVIDGDILKHFKDFIITVKATPKPNGEGTLVHWHFEYEKLHEGISDPHSLLEFVIHLSKEIDDHHVTQGIHDDHSKKVGPKKKSLKGTLEGEVEIKTDATIFHDVFSCRPHHISDMSPSKIQGVDLHDGDWGSEGTIICWSYRIEAIDDENLFTKYRVIDGDILKDFKDFIITVKANPKPNGEGTLVHWHFEYEKLHEGIPDPHSLLEFVIHLSKEIDDHHVTQGIHDDHSKKVGRPKK